MVAATLLALAAAVLHASWNVVVKSSGDRYAALVGQFLGAGLISLVVLALAGLPGRAAWPWALGSGLVHLPYVLVLAKAYDTGDFSLAYPVARGGGALLAAIGGAAFLHDDLGVAAWIAIVVIAVGLVALARPGAPGVELGWAVLLAFVIATYTLFDARGARATAGVTYVFATFVVGAALVGTHAVLTRQVGRIRAAATGQGRKWAAGAVGMTVVYWLVLVAVRHAPVGYVAALRESSVVVAAFIGWRWLGERYGQARLAASLVVLSGLIGLVVVRV